MTKYLLQGKLNAKEGKANELANILLKASHLVAKAQGCHLYVISRKDETPNTVFITEIWDSKEDHDNSLKDENVRNLIVKAMPLLDGAPEQGLELDLVGGFGI